MVTILYCSALEDTKIGDTKGLVGVVMPIVLVKPVRDTSSVEIVKPGEIDNQ